MSTKSNKEIARKFYEGYNNRDMDALFEKYISHDLVNHAFGGAFPRNVWLEGEKTFFIGFPDLEMFVVQQIAEGDKVVTHWQAIGTHSGEFAGARPSGRKIEMNSITIDRIADGKIVEHWIETDVMQKLAGMKGGQI